MKVTKLRSVIKTLTWRTIASLDTFLITWIVTGNPKAGITVSLIEVITNTGILDKLLKCKKVLVVIIGLGLIVQE